MTMGKIERPIPRGRKHLREITQRGRELSFPPSEVVAHPQQLEGEGAVNEMVAGYGQQPAGLSEETEGKQLREPEGVRLTSGGGSPSVTLV